MDAQGRKFASTMCSVGLVVQTRDFTIQTASTSTFRARDELTWCFFPFCRLDGVVPVAVEAVSL